MDRSAMDYELRGVLERLASIEARMATKDDLINMGRWLTTLILPIYGVLIVILIFLYNAKA